MKIVSVEKPTDSESFLYDLMIQSPKMNLEIYDRLLSVLIGISGVFLSLNDLSGMIKIFTFIFTWISLIVSVIGIFPDRKKIPFYDIEEMKEFVESRLNFKRLTSYFSLGFLFLAFGISLTNVIFKIIV